MRKLFVPALALLVLTYAMLAQAQRGGGPPTMPPEPGSLPSRNSKRSPKGCITPLRPARSRSCSNAVVVVNDEDVLIVDPGISAAAATALVADVKTLTNKPIKYVVDSHYHYDHAFGNQVFGPDVTIIGHDTVRRRLSGPDVLKQRTYLMNSTAAIANRFTQLKGRSPKRRMRRNARSTSGSSPFISNMPTSSPRSSRRRPTRRCRAI